MKTKLYFLIVVLLVLLSACGVSTVPIKASSTPAMQRYEATVTPEPTIVPTQEMGACQSERWEIELVGLEEQSIGNGWKFVTVQLAFKNGSDYWGGISISAVSATISTEDGFTYESYITEADQRSLWTRGIWGYALIPPGFTYQGYAGVDWERDKNLYNTFIAFKVADSQKHLTLSLNDIVVDCISPGHTVYNAESDHKEPVQIVLDNSNIVTPNCVPTENFESILQTLDLPNLGSITFTNVERNEGYFIFKFTFKNVSKGYEASGDIENYISILGEDGMLRGAYCRSSSITNCGGSFDAGPGQTVNGYDVYVSVPDNVHNLKVFFADTKDGIYKVFDIKNQ